MFRGSKKWLELLQGVTIALSVVVFATSILSFFRLNTSSEAVLVREKFPNPELINDIYQEENVDPKTAEIKQAIMQLSTSISSYKGRVQLLASDDPSTQLVTITPYQVRKLKESVNTLENQFEQLKQMLFGNASTVLKLGAITKDLETIGQSVERIRNRLREYATVAMWMIGVMVTISLALFGLVLSTFFKRRA